MNGYSKYIENLTDLHQKESINFIQEIVKIIFKMIGSMQRLEFLKEPQIKIISF
jgi:hypothetical protein